MIGVQLTASRQFAAGRLFALRRCCNNLAVVTLHTEPFATDSLQSTKFHGLVLFARKQAARTCQKDILEGGTPNVYAVNPKAAHKLLPQTTTNQGSPG